MLEGWKCPVCNKVLAPWIRECNCHIITGSNNTNTSDNNDSSRECNCHIITGSNNTNTSDNNDSSREYFRFNSFFNKAGENE